MSVFASTIWSDVRRAGERDPDALTRLVDVYRPAVVRFLIAGGFDAHDAEDVVQDVLIALTRPGLLARVDATQGRFRHLVLAVTQNVARGHRRRASALKRGGGTRPQRLNGSCEPACDGGADDFDREWVTLLVVRALERLELESERPERVWALRAFAHEGLSYDAIAAQHGITVDTVKVWIHRTRRRLMVLLGAQIAEYCPAAGPFARELAWLSRLIRR